MRFKKIMSLVWVTIFLICGFANITMTPVSAVGKETTQRTIAIVYDNSGSMFLKDDNTLNKAWCQALYAVEVFATMMNPGDKLMVYPMNPMGPEGGTPIYTRDNPLIIRDDSQKSIIQTLKSDLRNNNDDTPIEAIDSANAGLKNETADEKWLVVLTDGDEFYENGISLGKNKPTQAALEKRFSEYISDSNILYLGIGVKDYNIPNITPSASEFYAARSAESEEVPTVLTEMCNNIFGRDALKKKFINLSEKSINFDIPLSKLYVFIQGNEIGNVKILKDGKELKPIQTFTPAYNTAGCDYEYVQNAVVDENLKGYIASYTDLEEGTYTYSHTGTAKSTAFYYEVDADLDIRLERDDGTYITKAEEVAPGDYDIVYELVDKDGNILQSELLGDIDFKLDYSINGKNDVATSADSSGKMSLHLNEDTEFVLNSADVNFLSGYKIRKDGGELGFLSIPFKGIKGAAKPLNLKLSGGAKETDVDLVSAVPAYIATLTYDGKPLTGAELDNVQLDVEISGSGIKCDVTQTDSGFEIKLVPEEGLTVVPHGEYVITVTALFSSEAVADSSAFANARLRVKEVNESLSLELSYSNTVYSTIEGKVPEITASVKYNGEMLTDQQFGDLVFTAVADGIELSLTPLPDKRAHLITLNTDSKMEMGEYTIDITATGITGRIGDMLTANGTVGVKVQLLPQWLIALLWIIALLLLAFIIWLWLRTPVLPKVIAFDPTSVNISVDGETQKTLTANITYPKKGKSRTITIMASGVLNNVFISATLVPTKDSYRYLPSKRRKAQVVNGSVRCATSVSGIFIGPTRLVKDGAGAPAVIPAIKSNFTFPKGGKITFTGSKNAFGKMSEFSVSGTVVFKDKK